MVALVRSSPDGSPSGVGAGVVHAAIQLALPAVLAWLLLRLDVRGPASVVVVSLGVAVLGSVLAALVGGIYLFVTDRVALHPDAVFAVQHRTDFKSFVRLRFSRDGALDVFAYGIPQVVSMWTDKQQSPRARGRTPSTARNSCLPRSAVLSSN